MNHLVFLDTHASELEKILSGVKTMVVKEYDPGQSAGQAVRPGDSLYFLRDKDDRTLRVKATVLRVLFFTNRMDEDLSHILKELQPRLQLTEDQYNYWSANKPVVLVEFDCAHKISALQIAPDKIRDRPDWMDFDEFSKIT